MWIFVLELWIKDIVKLYLPQFLIVNNTLYIDVQQVGSFFLLTKSERE
jgi:hypothetical protein